MPATAAAPHPPLGQHRSRCRARAASSFSAARHRRRQHEVGPADLGLDPPGQPFQPGGVLGADAAPQVVGRDRAAGQPGRGRGGADGRVTWPGPSARWTASDGRIQRRGSCAPSSRSHSAIRSRPPSTGASASSGLSRRPLRIPGRRADEQHRDVRRGQPVQRLRARPRPAPRPVRRPVRRRAAAPRGRPDRRSAAASFGATVPSGSGRASTRPIAARRQRRDRDRRAGADDPLPQVDQPHARPPARGPSWSATRRPVAGRPRRSARPARRPGRRRRAGGRPTRSGTRSPRVRNGRSGSSTTTRPRLTSGRLGSSRARALAAMAGRAGQLQGQPDRGAAPGDVVVEIAVQPLEPAVQVGEQRDHQQLDVERSQAGGPGEPAQPQSTSRSPRPRRRRPPGSTRGVAVQRVDGRPRSSASSWSTVSSVRYSPRNGSSGAGSSARRSATSARTRSSTSAARPSR